MLGQHRIKPGVAFRLVLAGIWQRRMTAATCSFVSYMAYCTTFIILLPIANKHNYFEIFFDI